MFHWKPLALAASLFAIPALAYAGDCGCEKCSCHECKDGQCDAKKGKCSCESCKDDCGCHKKSDKKPDQK
jgi:hypothetical protein